jgi:hypothetical protein
MFLVLIEPLLLALLDHTVDTLQMMDAISQTEPTDKTSVLCTLSTLWQQYS